MTYFRVSVIGTGLGEVFCDDVELPTDADALELFSETMAAEAAKLKSCQDYPLEDWQYEVANGDTQLGYTDWVTAKRQLP
jgi:hypothetical protein